MDSLGLLRGQRAASQWCKNQVKHSRTSSGKNSPLAIEHLSRCISGIQCFCWQPSVARASMKARRFARGGAFRFGCPTMTEWSLIFLAEIAGVEQRNQWYTPHAGSDTERTCLCMMAWETRGRLDVSKEVFRSVELEKLRLLNCWHSIGCDGHCLPESNRILVSCTLSQLSIERIWKAQRTCCCPVFWAWAISSAWLVLWLHPLETSFWQACTTAWPRRAVLTRLPAI